MAALASTGNEATLATDTVQAMVAAAWAKVELTRGEAAHGDGVNRVTC